MIAPKNKPQIALDEIQIQPAKQLTLLEILRFLSSDIAVSCEIETLNALELNSIENIISYIAYAEKKDVSTVTSILTSAFDVNEVKDISSKHYENAVRFLMELNTKLIIN